MDVGLMVRVERWMVMSKPRGVDMRVSVVIRTRDVERRFCPLLKSLASQTVKPSEVVVVGNFSSFGKRQAMENLFSEAMQDLSMAFKMVTLPDSEFSHAYSTNLGVDNAVNELVCLMNAHSLPVSSGWLQDGVRHFEDATVAGVTGYFAPHRERKIGKLDDVMYHLLQEMFPYRDRFSTVNCIIRKSLWKLYPFDENLPNLIPETKKYGLEDYDWSKEMMARGYRIVVDPSFSVFHSHEKGMAELKRNIKNYFIYRQIQQKINSFSRPRGSFSRVSCL
jgi:GT2 family glycosyltransferase